MAQLNTLLLAVTLPQAARITPIKRLSGLGLLKALLSVLSALNVVITPIVLISLMILYRISSQQKAQNTIGKERQS